MSSSTSSTILTIEQLTFLDREGYLVVEDLLGQEDLQPVIDELSDEIDRRARRLFSQGRISELHAEKPFETRLDHITADSHELATSLWNDTPNGPAIFNLIKCSKIIDLAEQVCGPEIIASGLFRLRPKVPDHIFGLVPWHQDSGFIEAHCENLKMLTVWVPLVDSTLENGCLWVIPQVHKRGLLPHARRSGNRPYYLIPRQFLPTDVQPVSLPIRKGSVLIFGNTTPHASGKNQTTKIRWSIDFRYLSATDTTLDRVSAANQQWTTSRENNIPLTGCYPVQAEFLVRSRRFPERVVADSVELQRRQAAYVGQPLTERWNMVVDE